MLISASHSQLRACVANRVQNPQPPTSMLRLCTCPVDGMPLGEGVEEDQQAAVAAAWQAARAAGQSNSSWGGQATINANNPNNSTPGTARSRGVSGTFQLSFSADGSAPQPPAAGSRQQGSTAGGLRKQDTWVSTTGAASTGGDTDAAEPPAQSQEAAAVAFLHKHGFMVDDLVGDEQGLAVQRTQWRILLLHVISIIQRCLTAIMFGLWHFSYISIAQMGLLIALHAGFIGYLICVRPYASWLLLGSDVLAYLCELTVLAVAVMLQANPAYVLHTKLTHALVACYFFDVAAMIVPEVMRYVAMAWAWLQARQQQGVGAGRQAVGQSAAVAGGGADGFVMVNNSAVGLVEDEPAAVAAAKAASAALKLSGSGAR